jgi:hypothetical protein
MGGSVEVYYVLVAVTFSTGCHYYLKARDYARKRWLLVDDQDDSAKECATPAYRHDHGGDRPVLYLYSKVVTSNDNGGNANGERATATRVDAANAPSKRKRHSQTGPHQPFLPMISQ